MLIATYAKITGAIEKKEQKVYTLQCLKHLREANRDNSKEEILGPQLPNEAIIFARAIDIPRA